MRRDGKPVAAGFIYLSNSPIAHLEWLISDPEVKCDVRPLVTELVKLSESMGCDVIMTSFDNNQKGSKALKGLYRFSGFDVVGNNMTMMVKGENLKSFLCEEFYKEK